MRRAALVLMFALVPAVLRAQTAGSLLQAARAALEDIQPDAAATLLARALEPREHASTAEQARGWTLLGVAELLRGRTVSARLAFHNALERDPTLQVDSLAYLHSDLKRVFATERAAFVLEGGEGPPTVSLRVPSDTTIPAMSGQWPIEVQPRRPARVVAMLARADAPAEALWADTESVNMVGVIAWDLRARGSPVGPGHYLLKVTATDSAGRQSAPQVRGLAISRTAVDTATMPDPPTDSLLPDSMRLARGVPSRLLAGAALGAGALTLTSIVGNSSLNSGHGDGGGVVIAGAISIATVVGFLTARREHVLPANSAYNGQVRERWERRRQETAADNARRLAAAPLRVRLENPR